MEEKYILTLDIGTSTIRSFIYNSKAETVGKAVDQVVLHYPHPGFVEIDPDELWTSVVSVVHKSLKDAGLSALEITAMGISTQRGTFLNWSRKTGRPFHKFITWKDLRADKLVKQWNTSYTWKLFKASAYVLYLVLRSKRFKAGSVFKFMNTQTCLRLYWALQNVPALKNAVQDNDALFGTLDSWLLYKLTGGKIHMTDVSSASATGFYDPFTMQWAGWGITMLKIPRAALPEVVDTAGDHFTSTLPTIWGHPIRIVSCMADQTASMWGSCCFDVGDVKLTMGTGTFFNINTGTEPHASVSGLYPIVGWRLGDELVYSAEGANNDTASIIKWAQNLGLFNNPEDTAAIATSVSDTDGVYFIPAFSGLGPPYNDGTAASGFVGMKPSTTKAHLVRAVLESLAFRTAQLYGCVCSETNYSFSTIRLDGGVSNNDFIAQLVADLTGLRVERPVHVEMSSQGCAHIVGYNLGTKQFPKQPKNADAVATIPNGKDLVKVSPTIEDFHDITIDPPSEVSNSVLDTSSINVTSLENHEHEENSSPVPPMSPETLKLFDILYNDDDLNGNKDNTYDAPNAPMSPSTGLQGSCAIDSRCRDLPVPDEPKSMTKIHTEPCLEDTDLPEPDAPTSSPSIIAEPCSVDNLYNDLPMDPTSVDSCNADFPDAPMSPSTGLQGSRDIDSRCRDLPVPDEPKSMTRIHMEPCLENTDLPEPDAPTSSPSNLAKPCSVDSLFKELQMDPLSVDSYCTYLPTPDAPLYSPLTPACQNTSCFSRPQARKSPEERLRSVNSHYEDASTPDIPLCSPITTLHRNATSMNQNILENVTDDNDFSSDDHDRDPDYTPGIDRSKESSSSESNILDTILPSTSSSSLPNASEGNITDQGKPKRGRKRKFKEYTLAERKHRRYNNLPYMGKSHEVQPKSYKEFNCSCSKKCFLLVDSEKRKTEFLKFYSLTSYEAQLFYIISNVRETPTKRSYKCNNSKTGINKSRSFSRSYTLCGVSVCKDMFTKTLQISNQKLTISLRKNRSSVDSTKDLRGTLRGGWNKTPQEDVDFISNFINKIPKYQSHYRRENNGEKQYLQPGMTHTKLYNLYLEEFKNAYGESKKCVGFNVFRKIFLTKFNLKCKALKKDTCNICDRLAVQIKCCTSAETKTSLLQEKENHLKTAETLRTIMRNDMDKAKSDKMYECLTYDLEKTLPLPRIPTNLAFYKRQLWFYNCGVHAGSTNTGYCFVWVEGEAGRGAQEVGSCLVYYIKNILNKEVQHLVLWSDSCGGQNRNIKITLLLKAILESHPTLQTITLKYLQPGHTFLPNDTDFSKIETSLKLHPRLYTADDYINVIKKCRIKNPLIVKKMETQHFLGTQKLEKNIVNRKVSVDKNKINWLKIKEILLKKEKLYSLFIKTREGSEEINIEKKIKGKVLPINESLLCPLYPHGKEIAQAKMDDLRSLYPFIPRDCLPFYKNLKGSPNVLDDIDGLGTTPDFDIENSEEE